MYFLRILAFTFALICTLPTLYAHDPSAEQLPATALRVWRLRDARTLHGSLLMSRQDSVWIETETGAVECVTLNDLDTPDQQFVEARKAHIEQLNHHVAAHHSLSGWPLFCIAVLIGGALWAQKRQKRGLALTCLLAAALTGFSFSGRFGRKVCNTDPQFINAAFQPFKPAVSVHWDDTWFYVASKGIPTTHSMMTGITKWQQQVPIPQCYIGSNAWQIPLNPELADTPVPVNPQHFIRGAVAIAANGVPIFNPYTNTGVDALVDGQLDQWGGHSGRADDYHYHIAPLHLDAQTPEVLPIAFALDGFAVYGAQEPDGTPMLPLDANHGHFDGVGVYHYHGTPEAPYMIGNMVGKVTEDATMQIIPQSKATPVRPSLTPLNGATITGFQPNAGGNGYILTYTRNGQTYTVDYSWTNAGVYTYIFTGPNGSTTETYNGFTPCNVPVAVEAVGENLIEANVIPNPSSGKCSLSIKGLEQGSCKVEVFDLQGRLVTQFAAVQSVVPLDIKEKGVYVLHMHAGSISFNKKIVIQ